LFPLCTKGYNRRTLCKEEPMLIDNAVHLGTSTRPEYLMLTPFDRAGAFASSGALTLHVLRPLGHGCRL
jgi:hypothetical protein